LVELVRIDVGCTLIGRFEPFEVLGVRQSEAAGVLGVGGPPEVEAEESELERLDDQGYSRKLEIGVVRYYVEKFLTTSASNISSSISCRESKQRYA
jgi:hypothetical protein